jgi:hypothetical protein
MSLGAPWDLIELDPKAVPPVTPEEVAAATTTDWQTVKAIGRAVDDARAKGPEKELAKEIQVIRLSFKPAFNQAVGKGLIEQMPATELPEEDRTRLAETLGLTGDPIQDARIKVARLAKAV